MRALLLAAGLGIRLRPITNSIPKCLIEINGRPLLDYWIELLSEGGIVDILINLHHLPNAVISYIESCRYPVKVTTVYEQRLLGTGGTLLGVFIGLVLGLSLAAGVAYYLMRANGPFPTQGGSKDAREMPKVAKADKGDLRAQQAADLLGQAKREAEAIGNEALVQQANVRLADLDALLGGAGN